MPENGQPDEVGRRHQSFPGSEESTSPQPEAGSDENSTAAGGSQPSASSSDDNAEGQGASAPDDERNRTVSGHPGSPSSSTFSSAAPPEAGPEQDEPEEGRSILLPFAQGNLGGSGSMFGEGLSAGSAGSDAEDEDRDEAQEGYFAGPFSSFRDSERNIEDMSALQMVDILSTKVILGAVQPRDLTILRGKIEELEENHEEAREALEKLNEIVEKLSSPALRLGTLLRSIDSEKILASVNGTDYVCSVNPEIMEEELETGVRLLLNEALAVTEVFGFDSSGPVVKISEVLPEGRLRVTSEGGVTDQIVIRSSLLTKEKLRAGVEVRLDPTQRVAIEALEEGKKLKRTLTSVEEIPWSKVGGQDEAVEAIRDAIELPHLHPELFERFDHPVPKGILLFGPPGCGKTLLGKATAFNLRRQLRDRTGEDHPEFFLHVKGPEILNMWLGESERQVRELFAQCREKAADGHLSFLFIDEAESILGTRMGGRASHSIVSTLVPMFCTEMDGIEPLQNVIVILASNRADLIDPAILRPGRVDRKIRVTRPDREAAQKIYDIYVREELPLAEPREQLIEAAIERHYAETEDTRFLEIVYRSGRRDYLHRGSLASGALIAAIVERAKSYAIKRSIEERGAEPSPITRDDLYQAIEFEYKENELFPPTDITEDWLKLTDFDPENVVKLTPYRASKRKSDAAKSVSI